MVCGPPPLCSGCSVKVLCTLSHVAVSVQIVCRGRDTCIACAACAMPTAPAANFGRSAYFKTRFRSEVGQSEVSAAIDVSGVAGSLLKTLVEAMYSHEVRRKTTVCCSSRTTASMQLRTLCMLAPKK